MGYLNEVVNKLEEQEGEMTIWINPEFPIKTVQHDFVQKELRPLYNKIEAIQKQLKDPTCDVKLEDGVTIVKSLIADQELIDYLKLCCDDLSQILSSFWHNVYYRTFSTDGWNGYNHRSLGHSNDVIEVKDEE